MLSQSIFLTKVCSSAGKAAAQLLIDSIQTFGGEMRDYPIWVFATDPQAESCRDLACPQVEVFLSPVPETLKHYPFGDKVFACARAEAQVPASIQSLIWLDLECLIIQPPVLFALENEFDAALRPVHIRNVGLSPTEPLNAFWKGIYDALGIQEVQRTIESFVDHQCLRAYFNSHGFSIRPKLGLLRRWHEQFERLVCDQQFQETACRDERYQIFLFQALLSALITSSLDEQRIRILPPAYNYPYNLQGQVAKAQRAGVLNELVSITFEGRVIHPKSVTDIEIREPLRTWLETKVITEYWNIP
jgi:hypothetical protein